MVNKASAAFKYLGKVAKLVFTSERNKTGEIEFDGDSINTKINNASIAEVNASGMTVAGTFASTGALSGTTLSATDLSVDSVSLQSGVVEKTASVTLTATEIVGTDAGDIGHAAGATLVAAPGAGYALEFVSAVLIYDYATAAYTGGGDDNVIQNGDTATALTVAIAGADLLEAAGDKIVQVNALTASDQALVANKPLSFKGTALTQPGTAAGVLRCNVVYRVHTTNL